MNARSPRRKPPAAPLQAPAEPAWVVDATDGLEEFAGGADFATPTDEAPPEFVWLDTSEGLDEFTPELARSPLATAAPSSLRDVPIPTPDFIRDWPDKDVWASPPSRFDWMMRAGRAALLCAVVVAVADGILFRYVPAPPRTSGTSAEPSALPPFVPDPPSVGLSVVRIASSEWPSVAERGDPGGRPSTSARNSGGPAPTPRPRGLVTIGAPAAPETLAANPAEVVGSGAVADTSVAAVPPAPAAALSADVAPPAVTVPLVVADPSAAASPPAESTRSGSPDALSDTVAGPPRRELETRAIETVLGRYRNAFNRLDADAALAVWPTADEKNLTRAFDRLEDQDVAFDNCRIEILAGLAEAACSGTSRYVPKVGSRTPKAEARRWNFSLRKATGEWLIHRVDAR